MVLYGITLIPLSEELRVVDTGFLSPFYVDDAAFEGLSRRSAQVLKLLMKRWSNQRYFPKPAKSLFILDTLGQEEAARREFSVEGLTLNFFSGRWYLGGYLGLQEDLEAWVISQVEAWAHRVRVLGQIARRHPHLDYSGLGMTLQLEWHYLQRTVPGVGTLMGPIEEAIREKLFPTLFRGEEINTNFQKILGHSVKYGG